MKKINLVKIAILCIFLFLFMGFCNNENKIRKYQEKIPSSTKPSSKPHATIKSITSPLQWKAPESWNEETSNSRLRLATFSTASNGDKAICTIISLKGDGGGLRPNVSRWLNQLNIKLNSDDQLDNFIAKQERFSTMGNISAIFLDFTTFPASSADISMFITIVNLRDSTLFIKMTGQKSILLKNRDNYISLCKSLEQGK